MIKCYFCIYRINRPNLVQDESGCVWVIQNTSAAYKLIVDVKRKLHRHTVIIKEEIAIYSYILTPLYCVTNAAQCVVHLIKYHCKLNLMTNTSNRNRKKNEIKSITSKH